MLNKGNELYIICGSYGKGGTGTNGFYTTLDNGRVAVPAHCWKVVILLPVGSNDATRVTTQRALYEAPLPTGETGLPNALWFQRALAQHGYEIQPTGEWDKQTQRVLMNFQMRYRPDNYLGQADAETAALIWVLTNPVKAAP